MASLAPRKKPNLESVTTINEDGSRFMLHPADVGGTFTWARRLTALVLLFVYAGLPWIQINGYPAVFFDVWERRFHLFGLTFVAQDGFLAFFMVTGLGFTLFFLTSLFGRIWCGWTCPYTVFLEHVFRRIERALDGDAASRRRLDAAPWTAAKVARRILKHGIYLLAAAAIAHLFLSYFVSLPRLYTYMGQSPLAHLQAFAVVSFLTAALYFCFSWFREQFCIILCPYGRLQSALTDDNTLVIGYDERRGEPRGHRSEKGAGDCVDCWRCVQVCPTGIDIRNGLQLECIGCAACIDACDAIMAKVNRPTRLIRYDSLNGLRGGKTRFLRPRIYVYAILFLLGAAMFAFALGRVKSINASVVRKAGIQLPYTVAGGFVRNFYDVRLLTKRNTVTEFSVTVHDGPEGLVASGFERPAALPPQGEATQTLVLSVPVALYRGPETLRVVVHSEPGGHEVHRRVDFLGPDVRLIGRLRGALEPASSVTSSPGAP